MNSQTQHIVFGQKRLSTDTESLSKLVIEKIGETDTSGDKLPSLRP